VLDCCFACAIAASRVLHEHTTSRGSPSAASGVLVVACLRRSSTVRQIANSGPLLAGPVPAPALIPLDGLLIRSMTTSRRRDLPACSSSGAHTKTAGCKVSCSPRKTRRHDGQRAVRRRLAPRGRREFQGCKIFCTLRPQAVQQSFRGPVPSTPVSWRTRRALRAGWRRPTICAAAVCAACGSGPRPPALPLPLAEAAARSWHSDPGRVLLARILSYNARRAT
jgi:hypothetical protein